MVPDIEKLYKESLKTEGRLGELIDVDVVTAIDMMIENDQWDKALETAKAQNVSLFLKFPQSLGLSVSAIAGQVCRSILCNLGASQ